MKITKQHIDEARKVYDLYWDSYQTGNIDAYAATLDDNFEMIGTSESEICHSKEDGIAFYQGQLEEVVGKGEMRYRQIKEIPLDGQVLINELCDIYTLSDSEWSFYSKIRISTLLRETPSGWKVVQQHCSLPDIRVKEGETLAIDKISKENMELRDAVKRRTAELENKNRELEIEAALERVRSRSMAMHKSHELHHVINIFSDQLTALEIDFDSANFLEINADGSWEIWVAVPGQQYIPKIHVPYIDNPIMNGMRDAKKKGVDLYQHGIGFEAKNKFFRHFFENTGAKDIPEERKRFVFEGKGIAFTSFTSKSPILAINNYRAIPFSKEENEIFRRFANVFDQAYTRFLDLQKAEEQARESEIQLSLERVRARSISMQQSDELHDVLSLLFDQFYLLGIEPVNVFLSLFSREDRTLTYRATGTGGSKTQGQQVVSLDSLEVWQELFEKWKNDSSDSVEVIFYEKEILPTLFGLFEETFSAMPENERLSIDHFPDGGYTAHGYTPFGYIGFNHTQMPTDEEKEILTKFASEFSLVYQRFLDIERAEAQAREAEIQLALERVRARTMAMHNSDELAETSAVLFEQMKSLGVTPERMNVCLVKEDSKELEIWSTDQNRVEINHQFTASFEEPTTGKKAYEAWKKGLKSTTITLTGDELSQWLKYVREEMNMEVREELVKDQRIHTLASFSHGLLITTTPEPLPEESVRLMERFAEVFNLTYTRFLDLQKAEEQAREAQIEAALERIRTKTIAMHNTNDIADTVVTFFEELLGLALDYTLRAGIGILSESDRMKFWTASVHESSETILHQGFLAMTEHPLLKGAKKAWADGDSFFTYLLKGQDVQNYFQTLNEAPDFPAEFDLTTLPQTVHHRSYVFKDGLLYTFTEFELPEDIIHTLERFAAVFGQTYTRYLDLKRAEAQAREAQIENALEKVRSRSLAMQKPGELTDVVQLLREEMGSLGVEELETSSIYIHDESSGLTECWFTIKNTENPKKSVTDQMIIDLQETWVGQQMRDFYLSSDNQTSILMKGKNRIEWIRYCEQKSDLFGNSEFYGESIPERTYHLYKFSNGFLGAASSGEISEESWDIMKRATGVFSLAYTRFNDLQKAEESARNAQRQASLDRIRAEIASMRSAEDLQQITPIIWDELKTIGIPFIRCGVFIMDEENELSHTYLSTAQGEPIAALHLPLEGIALVEKIKKSWSNSEIYTVHWDRQDFKDWTQNLIDRGFIDSKKKYEAGSAPENLELHFLPFKHGMLYIGNTEPLDRRSLDLGQSMAYAFSVAYDRYEDFNKLEQAKLRIEEAFRELEAAQEQLVQQEKLASLGQLTAGIAHEIKNPLNFVNNFSDLSTELIQEARQEIETVRAFRDTPLPDDALDEVSAILDNIDMNLKKIYEHGTRADGIVKSMLEHSKGGTGKTEPIDLNALAKEFTNLSFHGMRAGKHPINVDIDLQLDKSIPKVPLVAEDFSRVIVNLCTNAFDAMREKLTNNNGQTTDGYEPKLTVRTQLHNNSIVLEIEDNGPGIPGAIKDKIMQPFFTTKKGTAGTGLGLSITNDIIKAQGGTLEIHSQPGSTRMRVNLNR